MPTLFTNKNLATFYLVLMCIQIIPIEGIEASLFKFGAMCFTPIILIIKAPYVTNSLIWGGLYFTAVLISIFFHLESFRPTTTGYLLAGMLMFITYYNLIYCKDAFKADDFILIIKRLILAYTIVLIIQQLLKIGFIGNTDFLLVNIRKFSSSRSLLASNSLSIEPSHSARIVGALFLALLRMYEVKWGKNNVTVSAIYQDDKWVLLGFLWTMFTMGSGTAILCLFILVIYFIKFKYSIPIIIAFLFFFFIAPYIEYKPLQRVTATIEAAYTLDTKTISDADLSASARVLPYVYTIENFNLNEQGTWIGYGTDTGQNNDKWRRKRMIGGMSDYGFLSYIFALALIFSACIRKFFSIETLFFVVILMAEIRNVYVWWAIFMLFATVKYFHCISIKEDSTV